MLIGTGDASGSRFSFKLIGHVEIPLIPAQVETVKTCGPFAQQKYFSVLHKRGSKRKRKYD